MHAIAKQLTGFEHASVFADLDQNGRPELYVAGDHQGTLRAYVWTENSNFPERLMIQRRLVPHQMITWNLMPVPLSVLQPFIPPPEDPAVP